MECRYRVAQLWENSERNLPWEYNTRHKHCSNKNYVSPFKKALTNTANTWLSYHILTRKELAITDQLPPHDQKSIKQKIIFTDDKFLCFPSKNISQYKVFISLAFIESKLLTWILKSYMFICFVSKKRNLRHIIILLFSR